MAAVTTEVTIAGVGGGGTSSFSVNVGGTSGGGVGGSASGGGGSDVGLLPQPSSPVPEWSGEPVTLRDFASRRQMPAFARIVRGSYMTIGASRFTLPKQHHDIYVHSVKVGVKVLAHCLRRTEVSGTNRRGRQQQAFTRLYSLDQRLAIPSSYQGWFEVLSEDGRSARPIASVHELAKVFPERCLVREGIKAYTVGRDDRLEPDKTKMVPAGEQLILVKEITLAAPSQNSRVKLLRCIDSKGDNVFLSFDQKGVFTPIAGERDFAGVFNIRDIIRRFRLPLTVKLAHGVTPRVDPTKFTGLIRLDWVYTDETAFVCPVEKNHVRLLPVPCDVNLQLVAASNQEEMLNSEMHRVMQAKCARMVANYNNTLHLIVTLPEAVVKNQGRGSRASNLFTGGQAEGGGSSVGRPRRSKSREDLLMDEIDDLYNYVRDGGAPPAPKAKFQYDSDEESYWEEPAYEALDDFRARLQALESGQKVSYPPQYKPVADIQKLGGLVGAGDNGSGSGGGSVNGNGSKVQSGDSQVKGPTENPYGVISSRGSREDILQQAAAINMDEPPPLPPRNHTTVPDAPPSSVSSAPSARRHSAVVGHQMLVSLVQVGPLRATEAHPTAPRPRTSRSDSEPSVNVQKFVSSVHARSPPKLENATSDTRLDWKERLRKFNALEGKDKEGSSSTSSEGTGGHKAKPRLGKDFKDSDISSRTKTSSSGSGSGPASARKRMQTLYL